jgi:SecD/SecF fusion protein
MEMDATGTRIWAKMTTANVGKPIAIVLDNVVYSAPFVNGPIPNGSSQISGSFSTTEASDLADILKSGKLPAPAKIVAEQQVGPTLGLDAVKGWFNVIHYILCCNFILMLGLLQHWRLGGQYGIDLKPAVYDRHFGSARVYFNSARHRRVWY